MTVFRDLLDPLPPVKKLDLWNGRSTDLADWSALTPRERLRNRIDGWHNSWNVKVDIRLLDIVRDVFDNHGFSWDVPEIYLDNPGGALDGEILAAFDRKFDSFVNRVRDMLRGSGESGRYADSDIERAFARAVEEGNGFRMDCFDGIAEWSFEEPDPLPDLGDLMETALERMRDSNKAKGLAERDEWPGKANVWEMTRVARDILRERGLCAAFSIVQVESAALRAVEEIRTRGLFLPMKK